MDSFINRYTLFRSSGQVLNPRVDGRCRPPVAQRMAGVSNRLPVLDLLSLRISNQPHPPRIGLSTLRTSQSTLQC